MHNLVATLIGSNGVLIPGEFDPSRCLIERRIWIYASGNDKTDVKHIDKSRHCHRVGHLKKKYFDLHPCLHC